MRKLVRTGVTTAGLVAALALALTGCGGDGGDSGGSDDSGNGKAADASSAPAGGSGASAGTDAGASAGSGGGAGSGGDDASAVEGTWTGLTDGKAVTLSVRAGRVALVADSHVCQGSVEDMGEPMFSLTCADGNTDRTMGAIELNDAERLVIAWDKGKKDTLVKTGSGTLPEGLPDDLPTDLMNVLPNDLPTP